jgi:hypothetical protein
MDKESEADLMNTFKVAANSLALLYKASQTQSRKAYVSGYQQALQDMWEFISLKQSNSSSATIPVQEVLLFIQSRHSETEKKPDPISAPTLATFELSIPEVSTPDFSDSLKRRWGFGESLNDDQQDQSTKRSRSKSDRMMD